MGVKVSKSADLDSSKDTLNFLDASAKCGCQDADDHGLQNNDNVRAFKEYQLPLLHSPSEQSLSSSYSACLSERPILGNSPLPVIERPHEVRCIDLPWTEESRSAPKSPSPLPPVNRRPPWSTVSESSTPNSNDHGFRIMRAEQWNFPTTPYKRPSRMVSNNNQLTRRSISISTLATIYNSNLRIGQAHLRRCTAAQQVHAHRPDISDSFSVDCCLSPKPPFPSTRRRTTRNKQCSKTKAPLPTENLVDHLLHVDTSKNRSTFSPSTIKAQPTQCSGDNVQETSETYCHRTSPTDSKYPLQYIFYIEDKPGLIKYLFSGDRISQLARDTHCHFHIQAQCKQTIRFNENSTDNLWKTQRIVEPALFYEGKRVRPVTVMARTMTDLRNFLKKLDDIVPEIGASEFLEKQLEIPTDSCFCNENTTKHCDGT